MTYDELMDALEEGYSHALYSGAAEAIDEETIEAFLKNLLTYCNSPVETIKISEILAHIESNGIGKGVRP